MLAELVQKLVDLGRGTQKVEFHTHHKQPRTLYVQTADGVLEKEAAAPLRQHLIGSFEDLVALLKDEFIAPSPEVYVDGGKIVAFLDRLDRLEMVAVALPESKRLMLCRDLEAKPRAMHPRDAVRMLRLELHSGNHQSVIDALSNIDFARVSNGKSHVEHGRESLGRSVEAHVQQADRVPKEFDVGVPIWTAPGFSRYGGMVRFGVFLDADAGVVELRVLSDECQRVLNQAAGAVVADLKQALGDIPVFLGKP